MLNEEVNSGESLVRQIESEPHPTEINEKSGESTDERNENIKKEEEETSNDGLKKKTKRKKSTIIETVGDENETIDIDYAIVQNEHKRQKIEIRKNNPKPKAEGLSVEKSPAKQTKDTKQTETSKLRSKYENIHANTVQKLNAQAEQLRMEISTLRTALANEQNAVRVLR